MVVSPQIVPHRGHFHCAIYQSEGKLNSFTQQSSTDSVTNERVRVRVKVEPRSICRVLLLARCIWGQVQAPRCSAILLYEKTSSNSLLWVLDPSLTWVWWLFRCYSLQVCPVGVVISWDVRTGDDCRVLLVHILIWLALLQLSPPLQPGGMQGGEGCVYIHSLTCMKELQQCRRPLDHFWYAKAEDEHRVCLSMCTFIQLNHVNAVVLKLPMKFLMLSHCIFSMFNDQ